MIHGNMGIIPLERRGAHSISQEHRLQRAHIECGQGNNGPNKKAQKNLVGVDATLWFRNMNMNTQFLFYSFFFKLDNLFSLGAFKKF